METIGKIFGCKKILPQFTQGATNMELLVKSKTKESIGTPLSHLHIIYRDMTI